MQFLNVALLMAGVLGPSAVLASPVAAPDLASAPTPGFVDLVPEASSGSLGKRSFVGSCKDCQVAPWPSQRTQDLSCNCRNKQGNYIMAYLDLDTCYINSNGTPQFMGKKTNGSFGSKCYWTNKGTFKEGSGSWRVEASCRNNNEDWITTSLDLDKYIHNDNGKLWCETR